MSLVVANRLTQLDVARAKLDKNSVAAAAALHEVMPIMQDMKMVQANMGTTHKLSLIEGEIAFERRDFNAGVGAGRSDRRHWDEPTVVKEIWSRMDAELYKKEGGKEARGQEAKAAIQGGGKIIAENLWYGNSYDDGVRGIANRLAAISTHPDPRYRNVYDNGATEAGGGNSSIYIVRHGAGHFHGIYPDHIPAGIREQDYGERTFDVGDGTSYRVVETLFSMGYGFVINHPRAVCRIANVYTGADWDGATKKPLSAKLLQRALNYMGDRNGLVIYMSIGALTNFMEDAIWEKTNTHYDMKDPYGMPLMNFQGVPIRTDDSISEAEDVVSATSALAQYI